MALVINDRVKETSTTTGTGTFTLDGSVSGFETFSSAIGNTNTTYYAIVNSNGEFEVGLGTVGAGTLSRDTILSSSNSDAAEDFTAGTKNVFVTLPASKAVILDSSGNIVANNGSNLTNLNASNLASGTVPDARFPATLPAISGANLTNLDASDLASGTVPDARFPATLPAISGANLTNLNATNVASGTLSADRLPTVPTTKGGTGLTTIGTANQVLAVNSGGTALEYQTPTTGDITGVTAGSGLTGGGTTGAVTLNVGAGTGIDVAADAISVDVSDFMTNGSNNRVLTATGTDAMNAEANMTFDGTDLSIPQNIVHLGDTNCYIGFHATDQWRVVTGGSERLEVNNTAITAARNFVPGANDTYDLGASGNVWRNIYTGDLHLSNEAKNEGNAVDGTNGNWTIQEGSEDLFLLNNKSGKKYKFKLEEI